MIDNKPMSFYILCLLETPGLGIIKVRKIIDYLHNENIEIVDIFQNPQQINKFLSDSQIKSLISGENRILELWKRLEDINANILIVTDDDYPEILKNRLGEKAPLVLTVLGNKNILKKESIGFCGSRKASSKGIETAYDCAQQIANKGYNVVSGYAAGIDMKTHCAALENGGTTTIVLAEGMLNFKIKREIKNLFDWEKVVVISEVLPGITWSVRNAMQRNKTICALSYAMILIESGINGGSMAAGRTCLELGIPLFAPVYEGMPITAVGNQELLKIGANPVMKNRKTNRANLASVFKTIDQIREKAIHKERQSRKQYAKLW
jgi:predicted Rossmann fold nucleotide-binding protein DprA/Smf involved in DNA uptake